MKDMVQFCYRIVEHNRLAKNIRPECNVLISTSECLCSHHPDLPKSAFNDSVEKKEEYKKELNLKDELFEKLEVDILKLFSEGKYISGGLFINYADALEIYNNYFKNNPKIILIGVAISKDLIPILNEELNDYYGNLKFREVKGKWIGNEIIGFDHGLSHSYLCNGLDKEIEKSYNIELNELGLLNNKYEEVTKFAEKIQGKGEPVEWIPVAIFEL